MISKHAPVSLAGEVGGQVESVMKISVSPISKFTPELRNEINRHLINLSQLEFITESDFQEALINYHSLVGVLSMVNLRDLAQKARTEEDTVSGNWRDKNPEELKLNRNDFITQVQEYFNWPLTSPHEKSLQNILAPYAHFLEDLALQQEKKINSLVIKNGDLPLSAELQGEFLTIFIHLARNAIDHGIETPDNRIRTGKDESGTIRVTAMQLPEGQGIEIHFSDDGAGIDPENIPCIFDFGFSTRETPSELSGKGVGLHSVRNIVKSFGREIRVESTKGRGAAFIFQLPSSR